PAGVAGLENSQQSPLTASQNISKRNDFGWMVSAPDARAHGRQRCEYWCKPEPSQSIRCSREAHAADQRNQSCAEQAADSPLRPYFQELSDNETPGQASQCLVN